MFCANCGSRLSENATKCSNCDHDVNEDFIIPTSGGVKGFFVMLASFFTMPVRTLRITVAELRDIGNRGALDVSNTDVPHLTWLIAASHLVASIVVILLVLGGLMKGVVSLGDLQYSGTGAVSEFVAYSIGGLLGAVAADWLIMISFEILGLAVTIANDIKRIADK